MPVSQRPFLLLLDILPVRNISGDEFIKGDHSLIAQSHLRNGPAYPRLPGANPETDSSGQRSVIGSKCPGFRTPVSRVISWRFEQKFAVWQTRAASKRRENSLDRIMMAVKQILICNERSFKAPAIAISDSYWAMKTLARSYNSISLFSLSPILMWTVWRIVTLPWWRQTGDDQVSGRTLGTLQSSPESMNCSGELTTVEDGEFVLDLKTWFVWEVKRESASS